MPNQQILDNIQRQIQEMQRKIAEEGITDSSGKVLLSPQQGVTQQQDSVQQQQQIQNQINQLQQQVKDAQIAGFGQGGRHEGQDIPEAILSGEQEVYDTGNQQLNGLINELSGALHKMVESGKVINPEIELTPAQITEFTNLASSQISPYYKSQIESIQKDLSLSTENLQKQYDISKQGAEESFKQSLGGQRETMAGRGTTFSGQRGAAEQQMVEAQNRALDLSALGMEGQMGSNLRRLEGQIGSGNLPTMPQFQTFRATSAGKGGFTPGRTLSFGGTGGVMGTLPQQQKEAELLRLSKYKRSAREGRSLDFYL